MKTVIEYIDELKFWRDEVMLLREIVISCGLEETIKWGAPCYTLGKDNVVGIAAFKNYVGLWFFQGGLLADKKGLLINAQEGKTKTMLQWRFHHIDEIQNAPIQDYVLESIENFKQGKKIKIGHNNKEVVMPDALQTALNDDKLLSEKWSNLSNACKREYADYINEAKRTETKISRLEKIKPMILFGKGLNDQYKSK